MRFWIGGPRLFGLRPGALFDAEFDRHRADDPALGAHGFVYVIQRAGDRRLKVGSSIKPQSRLKALQTGSPDRLSVAYSLQVAGRPADVERDAHAILSAYRVMGDWFAVPLEVAVGAINVAAFRLGAIGNADGASLRSRWHWRWTVSTISLPLAATMACLTWAETDRLAMPINIVAPINAGIALLALTLLNRLARA